MLYKRTDDCINEYRNVLLDVLNTYYDKGCLKYPETSDNAKARIEYQRTKLDSCKPEEVSRQKVIVSKLLEDYEKVKELENKYSAFVVSLQNILEEFRTIEEECEIAKFRFGFIVGEYQYFETKNYDDNLDDAAKSIIENFECYLRSIKNKRVEKGETVKIVSDIMVDQKKKYLQRYERELTEHIDDEDNLAFTKVEAGNVNLEQTTCFPTPPNAKWADVEMHLKDIENFTIQIKEIRREVNYAQMGFKYKTSTKKTKLWEVLLRFAMANNSPVDYYAEKTEVEKDVQRLNVQLIDYFGISGNPINYDGKENGYVSKFKIHDKSHLKEYTGSKRQIISEEESLDEKIDKDINNSCN